jgi:hypothetical protein
MHAYAYAMQMQCNYGAKHLRCYIAQRGGQHAAKAMSSRELVLTSVFASNQYKPSICYEEPE